jgi:exopolysaccharide biosynthesis protein
MGVFVLRKVRRIITLILVLSFLLSNNVLANTYFEMTQRHHITQAITYETRRMVTEHGFLDVYIMKVPLGDPYITVAPVSSNIEYGLKETTSRLLSSNGAIAGINGDFFGAAGRHSVPLGLEMAKGTYTGANNSSNYHGNDNASLLIDNAGNPFIEFINITVRLLFDGERVIPIGRINKMSTDEWPCIFTSGAIQTTRDLDARWNNLTKIVVQNGAVAYISGKGETVHLSDDGFIIVLNSADADRYVPQLRVGQAVIMEVVPSADLSKVESAITGAGYAVRNGEIAAGGGGVASGRHPRTAVGYSRDKKTLIMMVVDGRSRSIGATHTEVARLMIEAGAWDAIHLDGGGSSTFAVMPYGESNLRVLNNPSDGSQRAVINALGVFLDAPAGEMTGITIKANSRYALAGQPVRLDIYGYDEYYNRIDIPIRDITLTAPENTGRFSYSQGTFTPSRSGRIALNAEFEMFSAQFVLQSERIVTLTNTNRPISLAVGQSARLRFTGTGSEWIQLPVDERTLRYEVEPPSLGEVVDGVFTAAAMGQGEIRASYGSGAERVSVFIPVYVNIADRIIDRFDGTSPVRFETFPNGLSGFAEYREYFERNIGLTMRWIFNESDETQAAYAVFDEPIAVSSDAVGLRLSFWGTGSGDWLRGRLIDAEGTEFNIDFVRNIDFTGRHDADAAIPAEAKRPVALERIYAARLNSPEVAEVALTFYNIRELRPVDLGLGEVQLRRATRYRDHLNVDFYGEPTGNAYDVTVMGALGGVIDSDEYWEQRAAAMRVMGRHAAAGAYFGSSGISDETGIEVYRNRGTFRTAAAGGFYNISFATTNRGVFATDKTQWAKLESALKLMEGAPYVIVQTDTAFARFDDKAEAAFLHDILARFAEKSQTVVFVVSADAYEPRNTAEVRDSVRYINLPRFTRNGEVDPNFTILRVRVDGREVRYSLERVFE